MSRFKLSTVLRIGLVLALPAVLLAGNAIAANYKITAGHAEAILELETMSVDVNHRAAGVSWKMSRAGAGEFVYEQDGEIHEASLADAKIKTVTRLGESALLVVLEDFRLELLLYFEQDTGELVFKLSPREEDHNFRIKGIIYPRPFEVPIRPDSYSFFGIGQGVLIPGDWPEQEDMLNPIQLDDRRRFELFGELMDRPGHWWDHQEWDQAGLIYSERMACFGAYQPGSGWLAYIDDGSRMDNFMHVRHVPGKHTDYKVYWRPSMGSLSYPRIIRYYFQKDAGYAELIRHYRAYYEKLGYLKTLSEKNRDNPNVEQLKGAVNLRARVGRKDHRTFKFEIYNTFTQIGA